MRTRSIFSLLFLLSINTGLAKAQITPDGTIPTSVEQVENMQKITGGERVGDNLFHSFEEFSIQTGTGAAFLNALDVQNIITRITGGEVSFIDGLLKTAGGANLFLINPNGIVFGENAQLDVGGSFIATTADTIDFADGTEFSARNPKIKLTISVPIGLGLLGDNGNITVNGKGNQITNDSSFVTVEFDQRPTGLSVNNGQTLALVGNGLTFDGGVVTAEGGDIYLTSVKSGSVGIDQTESGITLGVNNVTQYEDINLNQQSLIDASGEKVGSVFASGQNINLSDASIILAQNQGDLLSASIKIEASESINLLGNSLDGNIASVIRTETSNNTGKGANINITTPRLSLQDGARIQAFTFSDAPGGNVEIETSETINLNNGFINASTRGNGGAGNLNLSTSQLRLINSANISSSSIRGDRGNGGNVTVNADSIHVAGASEFSRTNISTSSFTLGNAGSLTINTKELIVTDGASVGASSFNNGDAGNLTINASESVEVSGKNQIFQGSDNSESSIRTAVQIGRGSRLPDTPTGNAGDLTINSPSLKISQEGVITVENQGTGSAGKLTINADNLNLETTGSITAAAESGVGGEIFLTAKNLQIGDGSQISAEANNDGNGGNITINTGNIIAEKKSRVTANAFRGNGGNILVNAEGLFLFAPQEAIFTASSEFGLDGTVTINSPDNDFNRDLVPSTPLATVPIEFYLPRCQNPDRIKLYIDSGKYLAEDPDHYSSSPINNEELPPELKEKLEKLNQELQSTPKPEPGQKFNVIWKPGEPIVNATQVVETEDGRLFLVPPEKLPKKELVCGQQS